MTTPVRAADTPKDEKVLGRATGLFGIEEWDPLGGFENLLIRSTAPRGRVLRITHPSRRSEDMVTAEFEFMRHLAGQGVPAVSPIPSVNGKLVEHVEADDGTFLVVSCMVEAGGRHTRRSEWSPENLESYGTLLGSMHEASSGFAPEGPRRPLWTDPIFYVGPDAFSDADPDMATRARNIRDAAHAAHRSDDEILIHWDAHLGNILKTDSGKLSIFDFDDCAYGTPVHDLAIVFFYWLLADDDPADAARTFVPRFMRGYERHALLPMDWARQVEPFLTYRELEIYWLIRSHADDVTPAEMRFMEGRRERILERTPYLGAPLEDIL